MSQTDNISSSISRLFQPTNQGTIVLLNGSWGCGKTYLWNNKLSKDIEKSNPKTLLIYCSCFGIETLLDLKSKIVWQYLVDKKSRESKGWELTKKISQLGTKIVAQFGQNKLIGEKILGLSIDLLDVLDGDIVICFDDVERKSNKIPIIDLLGFFSFLAEQKNIKILLIANEQQIAEEDKDDYGRYKEKSIFEEFNLKADLERVYEQTISEYQGELAEFFKSKKNLVLKIFEISKNQNLRTLKRLISKLEYLVSKKIKLEDKYVNILSTYLFEYLNHKMKDEKFYDFSPMGVYVSKQMKTKVSDDERAEEVFLDEYFSETLGLGYEYVPEFFGFIRNGFLEDVELTSLKNRLFPKSENITKAAELKRVFNQIDIYYESESYVIGCLKKTEECLRSDSLKTNEIIPLAGYLGYFHERLATKIDAELEKIIYKKLEENILAGDDSFNFNGRATYSGYLQYWKNYADWYDQKFEVKTKELNRRNYTEILRNAKLEELKEVSYYPDKVLEFLDVLIGESEFIDYWHKNPLFFYHVFRRVLNQLQILKDVKKIDALKKYLIDANNHQSADRMDKARTADYLKQIDHFLTTLTPPPPVLP